MSGWALDYLHLKIENGAECLNERLYMIEDLDRRALYFEFANYLVIVAAVCKNVDGVLSYDTREDAADESIKIILGKTDNAAKRHLQIANHGEVLAMKLDLFPIQPLDLPQSTANEFGVLTGPLLVRRYAGGDLVISIGRHGDKYFAGAKRYVAGHGYGHCPNVGDDWGESADEIAAHMERLSVKELRAMESKPWRTDDQKAEIIAMIAAIKSGKYEETIE